MAKGKPRKKRRNLFRKLKPGTSPGTLVADPNAHPCETQVLAYNPDEVFEAQLDSLDSIPKLLEKWRVTWINVNGLKDVELVRRLGDLFSLHKLALEDVVNVHQRAKVEAYSDHLFVISRMLRTGEHLETEQFSMFMAPGFILTFQETQGDCFDPVRDRIRKGLGTSRNSGTDYLAYMLVDAIIDSYFPVIEHYDEQLDLLEMQVMEHPGSDTIGAIHTARKDLLILRRAIWPMREAVNALVRSEGTLVHDETRIYFRDCYDHTIQVIDMLENLREITSGLIDLYHSNIGNRMNEIMKVLTLIATLFIPLSFVAGLYGMNFDTEKSPLNMPELRWYFGYPLVLLLMLLIASFQLFFFWRKGWIRFSSRGDRKPGE
ncbi:MAG: magnesium/cobalt transporter CorA [Planctomycetota bacterium]